MTSNGQELLPWGDTIHLAEAANQGLLVGGAHVSFPGLGHVRADATGYSWIPLPHSAGVPRRPY
jgi:hypothetical protein